MGVAASVNPRARVLVVLGNAALNGQERGNIEVYRSLQATGVDALFVTHAGWGRQQIEPYLDRLGLRWTPLAYAYHFRRGMTIRAALANVRRLFGASRSLWRIARSYRPTHIHVANPHYVLSVLPALRLLGVPVVFRLGDVPTLHSFYGTLWRRAIVPLVWRFVCISRFVAEAAVDSGVPREKVRVVLSAPPRRPPHDAPGPLVESLVERGGAGRTVLYLGQVSEHKGVHLLLEAARMLVDRHPALQVLIAGRASANYGHRLAAQALGARLTERVRFLGYVEDVPGLFAAADVHVCPSVCQEALGNVVLEAKQAGVPSVVFPDGGLPELVVEEGRDGVVCEACTGEALAAGLEHYLSLSDSALAEARDAAQASLSVLGSDEASFQTQWLEALGVPPSPSCCPS